MKFKAIIIAVLSFLFFEASAQKGITKEGVCEIYSQTPTFTIEGVNKKVASVLDYSTGNLVASTLVRSFRFKEALVEEHFNENYLEPNIYPKAMFKGKIVDFNKIDLTKNGTHNITFMGKLTIHGVTHDVTEKGTLTVKDGNISTKTVFSVSLKAYKVRVEKAYTHAIKDDIELRINFNYKPYKTK